MTETERPPTNGHIMLGFLVIIGVLCAIVGAYEVIMWIAAHATQIMEGLFVVGAIGFIAAIIKGQKASTLTAGGKLKRKK